ncbi:hypothetical protein [Pseudoxanthomonas sp.]|uniref:hypothetical protein n=1 Tax=Pseudoxanthomonas sp. TaxID=1871049 RepID=UPI0028C3AB09|nr:hypothetical protein [Pseudoxanthomonas sp.]
MSDNPYAPPGPGEPGLRIDHWIYLRAFFIAFAAATVSIIVVDTVIEGYYHGNDITNARRWAGLLLRAPIVAVVPSVLGGLCAKLHVVFAGLLGLVAGPIAWYVVGA